MEIKIKSGLGRGGLGLSRAVSFPFRGQLLFVAPGTPSTRAL